MGLPAGFDFHHVRGEKDFNVSGAVNKAWEYVKRELDKCELLCRCCHAIHHSKQGDELLLKEIANYNGKLLRRDGRGGKAPV